MKSLLNADDDWQESLRKYLYPKLHPYLTKYNGYAVGKVSFTQHVADVLTTEEVLEVQLSNADLCRNPISAYKSLPDGRESEGSWVLLHHDAPEYVDEGLQLHITLFKREKGAGLEIYAHLEDDWRVAPLAHLREENFHAKRGAEIAEEYLDAESDVRVY